MAVLHRLTQGIRALGAFTQPIDDALAPRYLTPEQMTLFKRMTRSEQLHSLRVLRDVLSQDAQTPDDLAVACLLHDVGKSRYTLNILQRSLPVILKKFAPKLEEHLSTKETLQGWRAPFEVRRHHPKWGAAMLCKTLCQKRAVWLVARHADDLDRWRDHPHYPLLERLKHADDRN